MDVAKQFYSRDFSSDKSKDAYLLACEWVAKNILNKNSKVEVLKITWRIYRLVEKNTPTFRLELFATYNEDEINEQVCKICKESHSHFFINENYNCNRCNKEAYRKRVENKLNIGCEWFNEQISKMLSNFN